MVIQMAETANARATPKLLEAIGDRVRSAVDLLKEPDKDKQRIGFILLAIQQSTEVRKHIRNRKEVTRVHVIDQDLYHWGMGQLHTLAITS